MLILRGALLIKEHALALELCNTAENPHGPFKQNGYFKENLPVIGSKALFTAQVVLSHLLQKFTPVVGDSNQEINIVRIGGLRCIARYKKNGVQTLDKSIL